MSRLQRSPPAPPTTPSVFTSEDGKLVQVASDSDIPQSLSSTPFGNVNTSSRHKRPHKEVSPTNELQEFKHEILEMLTAWKKDQEANLKTFLNDQSSSMSKLVAEISQVKSQNSDIQKTSLEIEKTVGFINQQYDDMIKQIEDLQKEKQGYRQTIQMLEAKIQDLQVSTRSSTVEIRNVAPTKENESMAELVDVIGKLGTVVNVPINPTHIRDIYRLPGKSGSIKPIVTEFSSVQTKLQFLKSVREFNKKYPKDERLSTLNIGMHGDRRPIYIAEFLPPSSRRLFFAARECAKLKGYKFCWTNNGNVFMRKTEGAKQILIKNEQMLGELEVSQ